MVIVTLIKGLDYRMCYGRIKGLNNLSTCDISDVCYTTEHFVDLLDIVYTQRKQVSTETTFSYAQPL
jgi:hypothetical protein